jgi:hypothetical protein
MTATTIRVQMAQRKDTAANWTAANPILLSGEIGYETDTKKFKIGNGSTNWNSLAYLPIPDGSGNLTITGNLEIGSTGSLTFEGSTADGFETTLAVTNPTADRTITLPNQSGTVLVSGNASIVDADIAANAEIAVSKLADGTARQLLQTDAAGTGVEWTSNVDIPGTLDVTGAATFDATVTVAGDLTVNGTTTTISTQNLLVEDKNIIIGDVASPTDVTADGGGITLKGATDKTLNWVDATDAWTSSERFSVPLGSASTPSLTFTGDPNTGIYSPGADQVAISTNGTGRLFINANGEIGANTTSATAYGLRLGPASGQTISLLGLTAGSTSANSRIDFGDSAANDIGRITYEHSSDAMFFNTNGSERLRITSAGLVGIGTSSPNEKLHLGGSSTQTMRVDGPGVAAFIAAAAADITQVSCNRSPLTGTRVDTTRGSSFINLNGTTSGGSIEFSTSSGVGDATLRATIDSSGRVGIGTTGPQGLVDVAGSNGRLVLANGNTSGGMKLTATNSNYTANGYLVFEGYSSEYGRFDSSGRLLVGTSSARSNFYNGSSYSPRLQLESANNGANSSIALVSVSGSAFDEPNLVFAKSRGSAIGDNTIVASGDDIGSISFQASDGSEFVVAANILAEVDGTPGANDMPGRLVFSVTADGASSPTEAMRIKNSRILNFANTPVYADNAAAKTGGLVDGDVYRKSDGTLMIVYT